MLCRYQRPLRPRGGRHLHRRLAVEHASQLRRDRPIRPVASSSVGEKSTGASSNSTSEGSNLPARASYYHFAPKFDGLIRPHREIHNSAKRWCDPLTNRYDTYWLRHGWKIGCQTKGRPDRPLATCRLPTRTGLRVGGSQRRSRRGLRYIDDHAFQHEHFGAVHGKERSRVSSE